jgi:hypothetical protein
MLFNEYLCNQPCHCQVVVEPGAQLCTLLEVWVLGVGMSTLGHKRLCRSYGLLDWSTLILSVNKTHLSWVVQDLHARQY